MPANVAISQGRSASVTATVSRYGGYTGQVALNVTGLPEGITIAVSNIVTNGQVTSATLTFDVSGSVIVGSYLIDIHATGPGIADATVPLALIILEGAFPCVADSPCAQWAVTAVASSEYMSQDWGAMQATGLPDVPACFDDVRAWASTNADGVDWLELNYVLPVRPTGIHIHESNGVSSIVKVEVRDGRGEYFTVYTASPGRYACPRVLSIPVTGITEAIRTVRVTIDQRTLRDWNEIDAVKLVGIRLDP
jgi:hypothetical protein